MNKVLIIKTGFSETLDQEVSRTCSLGDVLRTTVVLHHFKTHNSHVTWLVDEKAYPLLEGNPMIDRILFCDPISLMQLQHESFDVVANFEKVPGLCALGDSIKAWKRYGFRFDDRSGKARGYDGSERVFQVAYDPEMKRTHRDPWQKILMEMIGAKWDGQEYVLGYRPGSEECYDVGFNHAVGSKWPEKAWPTAKWEALSNLLETAPGWQKGFDNLHNYMEWIASCKTIVTTDSLGLHIALAMKKRVIALFGPTNANETYMYNRGTSFYDMHSVTPEQVAEVIRGQG